MELLSDQYMSTSVWILATTVALIIVAISVFMYVWFQKRLMATLSDSADAADLAAEKEQLQADVQQCRQWLDENREELLRQDAERQQQEILREELNQLSTEIVKEEQKLEEKRNEAENIQHIVTTLAKDKNKIEDEQNELKEKINFISKELADLESQQRFAEEEKNKLVKQRKEFEDQIQQLKEEQRFITEKISKGNIGLESQKQELSMLNQQQSTMQEGLLRLEAEFQQREHLQSEIEELKMEVLKLEQKQNSIIQDEKNHIQKLKEEVFDKKSEKDHLEIQIESLKAQLGEMHPSNEKNKEKYSSLFDIQPKCLDRSQDYGHENQGEEEILARFADNLKNKGYYFSDRVIRAFHTSIKTNHINPLTVLAGISGTGKSLLPIQYAEAFGMHNLLVSVQPRWDSPQDLFGFYNYLEHEYKATELLRTLVRMDEYNFDPNDFPQLDGQKRNDGVLLVLLDEMNLARTEYYFSEFLSKLEMRRMIIDQDIKTERTKAEFELEIDQKNGSNAISRLWVGNNVIFVGTMNEDESTQTLSDKVLDRSNVLRFGKPPENNNNFAENNSISSIKPLSFDQWKSWYKDLSELKTSPLINELEGWIKKLNNALEIVSRPFGYRVKDSINAYVINYPGVEKGNGFKLAVADQIEQKIIPKLRGLDISQPNTLEALDEIGSVIDELDDLGLSDAFDKCRSDDQSSEGLFLWKGITREI